MKVDLEFRKSLPPLSCDSKYAALRSLKEAFAMRRSSVGPRSAPTLEAIDEVTLRTKNSGPPVIGPGFMRRSCTFVTEGSWRKNSFGLGSSQKESKDRANLALQVRKKAAQLGSCEEEGDHSGPLNSSVISTRSGRVSRLVGNLKSWSSSDDVRQSVVGALAKTVNVIKQRPASKKVKDALAKSNSSDNGVAKTVTDGKTKRAPSSIPPPKSKTKKSKDTLKNGVEGAKIAPDNKVVKNMPNKTPVPKKKKVLNIESQNSSTSSTSSSKPNKNSKAKNENSTKENKKWLRHLHDAQASYNAREGRNRRPHPTPHIPDSEESAPSTDLRDVEDGVDADNSESVEGGNEGSLSRSKQENIDGSFNSNSTTPQASSSPDSLAKKTESGVPPNSSSVPVGTGSPPLTNPSGVAPRRRLQEVQIIQIVEGPSLIQPSEVKVSQGVVLSAEPVLTPIELLRRKDLKIRQELEEKQTLIADILNIPHQDFESVADMAGEVGLSNQEPRELVLGAIYQAKKLQEALNEAQSIRDSDIIAAQACSDSVSKTSIPFCHTSLETMEKLNNITGNITQFLNSLMVLISERDDERERMRKELVASRERIHQLHMHQQTILQEHTSSSESQTQGSQSTLSSSSSIIANTVVSTSIEPVTPHSSRPSSFVSANSSGAEQSELTDQQTTDEEGRSEDVSSAEVQSQSWLSIERNEGESTGSLSSSTLGEKTGTNSGVSSVLSKEQQSEETGST